MVFNILVSEKFKPAKLQEFLPCTTNWQGYFAEIHSDKVITTV
jgi:hypothetical protein